MSGTSGISSLIAAAAAPTIRREPIRMYDPMDCVERIQRIATVLQNTIGRSHEGFNCPVTQFVMKEPTSLIPCGHTIEQEIFRKIIIRPGESVRRCPLCVARVREHTPNISLKGLIQTWLQQNPYSIPTLSQYKESTKNPARAAQYLAFANTLKDDGDYQGAEENFAKAFLHTNSSADYAHLPALYEKAGKAKEEALAYLHLSLCQLQEDQIPEAIATLERCKAKNLTELKLDPIIVGLKLMLNPFEEITHAMELAAAHTDPEQARDIYKLVLGCNPYCYDAYRGIAALSADPTDKHRALALGFVSAKEEGNIEEQAFFKDLVEIMTTTSFTQLKWVDARAARIAFPYPQALVDYLKSPCPIHPGKTVEETHVVVPLFDILVMDLGEGSHGMAQRTLGNLSALDKSSGGAGCREISRTVPTPSEPPEEGFRWAVLAKEFIPETLNKSYEEQVALLPAGYEVPSALDVATALLFHARQTGQRLLDGYVRTRTQDKFSTDLGPYGVNVGAFTEEGVYVSTGLDAHRYDDTGLIGIRKF